ncbi:MAG: diaminopropionate ammonia-lyase [Acidobacteria bacterium]|nr:diaminopropionate ammonia-lyase [Acidobacteriota bacterium]
MSDPPVRVVLNPWREPDARECLAPFGAETAREVRGFHATLDDYAATPLHALPGLAGELGLGQVWVKDEGHRFGLKAFKGLGASYAMARIVEGAAGPQTFVTATDGNHGRAVAWAAQRMGHRSIVYLPEAASVGRAEAIAELGAEIRRTDGDYEAACREAADLADNSDATLLQDVAWPGYDMIPRFIMQGYLTLMDEAVEQMAGESPTHVLLQCGVGSFAGAVAAYCLHVFEPAPQVILVEPAASASAEAAFAAGTDAPPLATVTGHPFMACLACAQLSTVGWDILRRHADALIVADDDVARLGMRELATPRGADPAIVSGESGAATTGALIETCRDAIGSRARLGLDADARVLLISTEGDTDPEVYRATVAGA